MKRFRLLPMRLTIRRNLTFFLLFAVLGGCADFNCTRLEDILGGPTNLIEFSYKIADNLVERALPPLFPQHPGMPVLVTSFVDNNDLEKSNQFGRTLQEQISSRLVQLGYSVREIKLAETLTIIPREGEKILTRDLTQLRGGQQAQAIVAGTFSRSNRILYVSARLIDPSSGNIIATDDYKLCMDDNILQMFGLQRQNCLDSEIEKPSRGFLNSIFW
jgi:TolB-like protein